METWNYIAVNDDFWAVREAALKNLSEYHNPDFTALFLASLVDQKSKVRVVAIRALGNTGNKKNIKRFKKIFRTDDSYLVMAEALKSVGKCGSKGDLKFLREATKTQSHRNVVSRAAEQAISMITN